MYSVKTRVPKAGIDCLGNPVGFATVGEPYDTKVKVKNSRWAGKQLGTKPMVKKSGDAARKGYFSSAPYIPEEYFQAIPYLKTQPPDQRKMGFGSKDAFKSDEFTNAIATEVYRQTLKNEQKMYDRSRKALEAKRASAEEKGEEDPIARRIREAREKKEREMANAPTLYDLVHNPDLETYGLERKRQLFPANKNLNYGAVLPMSTQVGEGCGDRRTISKNKAKFGGKHSTDEFFDKGHMQLGAFAIKRPEYTIGE
jgi:hypothetical protein